jgi:eukaryotic-like serine/threonine-protein kinase
MREHSHRGRSEHRERCVFRIAYFVFLGSVLFALCGFASAQPTTRPIAAFQGGGPLLGRADDIAPPPMKVRWTYKTNPEERAGLEASPVIAGPVVYVADNHGVLHAVDLKTGKAKWQFKADDGFATSPLITDSKVMLGDMTGIFYCVSAETGKKLWTVDAEAGMHSSPNLWDDRVVFGTDASDILCLSLDGKVLWKAKAGDRVNAAPAIGDGLAYFSGCDAHLRAFDIKTGQEQFAVELGAVAPGSAVLTGKSAIIGTDQGRVVCVDIENRKPLWVYQGVENEAMVYATPAVSGQIAVVGARDRNVHAIDIATGKGLWKFATSGDVDAPAVISAGRVYVTSQDKKLYVLDLKTGKELWKFAAGRGIEAGVAIGSGVLVFGDSAGNVYCLERAAE